MTLKMNQACSITAIFMLTLNSKIKNLIIKNCELKDDEVIINVIRHLDINELKKFNEYYNVTIKSKKFEYQLVMNKKTQNLSLELLGFDSVQTSLFLEQNKQNEKLKESIQIYNQKITERMNHFYKLLYEVVFEDLPLYSWTFYYISENKDHIGFANISGPYSYKIPVESFSALINNNESIPEFYENCSKFVGTIADVQIACLKRNYNSKHNGNWKYCSWGTSIEQLWPY